MSDAKLFGLVHAEARRRAHQAIDDSPDGYIVQIKPPTRTSDANAAMWPILDAFSKQLQWPVNGQMVKLEADEWKSVLSAAFRQETARVAMGLNGGMVMLGLRTSKMSKKEFSEFLDFINYVAAERGVEVYKTVSHPVSDGN